MTDFLFRPTEGHQFLEQPLTSAALHDRFVKHLQRFGLYKGTCLSPPATWRLCHVAVPVPPSLGLPASFCPDSVAPSPNPASPPCTPSSACPLGSPAGQSPHGVRRGTMQHDHQSGTSFTAIQERAQIKTDRIVHLYLDPAAHLRGGKGQKRLMESPESDSDPES